MSSQVRSADDIARLFADRLPVHGGWISAKQAAWLRSVAGREGSAYLSHGTPMAEGILCCQPWTLYVAHNGAGRLAINQACEHRPCEAIGCSCKL